jgi:hypothetical protein
MSDREQYPEQSDAWHQANDEGERLQAALRDLRRKEAELVVRLRKAFLLANQLFDADAARRRHSLKFRAITKRRRFKAGWTLTMTRFEPRKAA